MSKRKVALLMTVGGDFKGTNADNYAKSLLISISNYNPDKIVLFGSNNSKSTLNSLETQYLEEFGEDIDYSFREVEDVDSFDKYFQAFKDTISELEEDRYEIRIDYTLGTKTMSISAALASVLYHKKLCFVKGERGDKGIIKGSEEAVNVNLYKFYDKVLLEDIWDLFNNNRFDSALALLNGIVDDSIDKVIYTKFFKTYSYFDKVNFSEAFRCFDRESFILMFPNLESRINTNFKALNIIYNPDHSLRCFYILASILNNDRRRADENKFDDAVARLYRCLELICQIRLKKNYDLVSSNIDVSKLSGVDDVFLEDLKSREGNVKLGLVDDFRLLFYLGDDLGKHFMDNALSILNIINYRNSSILAHGLNYSLKENYDEFYTIVLEFAHILSENIDDFVEDTKFPVF